MAKPTDKELEGMKLNNILNPSKKGFAVVVLYMMLGMLLKQYTKTELKKMLTTKKIGKILDVISSD